jgi:glycosyltransferase involved in cell wall biosynthesis
MAQVGIIHYTAPPVIGGVEAVMQAHMSMLLEHGYQVTLICGRGDAAHIPEGVRSVLIPEIDSLHPQAAEINRHLEQGVVPGNFEDFSQRIYQQLEPLVGEMDDLIVHNILTKHFNLPLSAALVRLLDEGKINNGIAWCHDFSWTSPSSRSKVHEGYPWDILRNARADLMYVVVSKERQATLAELFGWSPERIRVVYNGVDARELLGLSTEGLALIKRLGLLPADLVMLLPVRVTRAKNIEYALQVTAALARSGWRVRLVVSGPPDPHDEQSMAYFESLKVMRRELGIEEQARFVFESSAQAGEPYTIDRQVVGDLYRVSDLLFMPSHREGFGMPVMEAGLVGLRVVSTGFPAAVEIGGQEVEIIDPAKPAEETARQVRTLVERDATIKMRQRVRQSYLWQAIFEREIEPLLAKRRQEKGSR